MGSQSSAALPTEPVAVRRRGVEDLISDLPDEILHDILVRLPSAAAATRTSVLSRRWRGVWAHMPELALGDRLRINDAALIGARLDSIDAALNSYAAPTLRSLRINVSGVTSRCGDVPTHRVASWLRFASQRLAGRLRLGLDLCGAPTDAKELALPICEKATEIVIFLLVPDLVLRLPPTGSFSALTDLRITCIRMDGGELGRVVSSPQCPRLRKLLILVSELDRVFDVTMRSESLEYLNYSAYRTGKLEVTAPMLQEIYVTSPGEAWIVAPKLEKVEWRGHYNPALHQFGVAQRHLQSLTISHASFPGNLRSSTQLMERYDTVKELKVFLGLHQKIEGYVTFLKQMDKLPVCDTLVISLMVNSHHALPAVMFHLLRRCSCIRKLELFLGCRRSHLKTTPCSMSGCPCLLPDNCRLDGISFDSLEEIKIDFFEGSREEEEFMKLLLPKCNMVKLKKVKIMVECAPVPSEIMEVVERIRGMCHPNSKVQLNVLARRQ